MDGLETYSYRPCPLGAVTGEALAASGAPGSPTLADGSLGR